MTSSLPLVKMTNRTSYVIARDGRIVMVHSDLDWKEHVAKTLAAVRALKPAKPPPDAFATHKRVPRAPPRW